MFSGILCKVFRQKEITIEDFAKSISNLFVVVGIPTIAVICDYHIYTHNQNEVTLINCVVALVGVCASAFTVIMMLAIIDDWYKNHKNNVVIRCPRYKDQKTEQEEK